MDSAFFHPADHDGRELDELCSEFVREFLAQDSENPGHFASICLLGHSQPTIERLAKSMRIMLANGGRTDVRVEIKDKRPGNDADAYWIDVGYFMNHLVHSCRNRRKEAHFSC